MELYRYTGNKDGADGTERLIVEVDASGEPVRAVDLFGEIALTDDEASNLKQRFKLTKVGDVVTDDSGAPIGSLPEGYVGMGAKDIIEKQSGWKPEERAAALAYEASQPEPRSTVVKALEAQPAPDGAGTIES